jgi:hypothetical protein
MLNYAEEQEKKVVLICNGCGVPCGGATAEEAAAHATESGWFEVPFGPSEKRWYCDSHPNPADEGTTGRLGVR